MITTAMVYIFLMGAFSVLVAMGAAAWFKDLGLKMTWWKWLLAGSWYFLLIFFVLLDFTLIGEGEVAAGWKLLLFESIIMIILGVGLWRVLWAGKEKQPS